MHYKGLILIALIGIALLTGCVTQQPQPLGDTPTNEQSCKEFCSPNKYSIQYVCGPEQQAYGCGPTKLLCICGGPQNG